MIKDAGAFLTISEVAEALNLPQHVLRFWESKFPQIRPLKRSGGRRYYRPDEVELLRSIRRLLHEEGYTIKGVQRILKVQGVRSVASLVRSEAAGFVEKADAVPELADPADDRSAGGSNLRDSGSGSDPVHALDAAFVLRSLSDIARELEACRAILAAVQSASTPA